MIATNMKNIFFFLSKTCPNLFLVVTNTLILLYRLFWNVSIFQNWKSFWITVVIERGVIQGIFSYWLWIFFQCSLFPLEEISLWNSNHTCELRSICLRLAHQLPLSPACWYSLLDRIEVSRTFPLSTDMAVITPFKDVNPFTLPCSVTRNTHIGSIGCSPVIWMPPLIYFSLRHVWQILSI